MREPLRTTREIAECLGVCPETVLRLHAKGLIAGYRIATNALRFRDSDVDAYLHSIRRGGEPGHRPVEEGRSARG